MMYEQVEGFVEGLISKTKKNELDWKPLSLLDKWHSIEGELEDERISIDFLVNSVRVSKSYYLQSGEGYVFLFEIYHGNPEVTSPEMDTMALMVKINDALLIDDLSSYSEEEQENLRTLQILVEAYYDQKYCYPDILYDFFRQVINGK